MSGLRALLVLVALLAAGCVDEGAVTPTPLPTGGTSETKDALTLGATLVPDTIRPGEITTAEFLLENAGADATTLGGGCGSDPWRFEITAPNGTRVGPIGPDPRCLGPPHHHEPVPSGGMLAAQLRWDGNAKWRDDSFETHQEPAPPGMYMLRASIDAHRGDTITTLTVTIAVRVSS